MPPDLDLDLIVVVLGGANTDIPTTSPPPSDSASGAESGVQGSGIDGNYRVITLFSMW